MIRFLHGADFHLDSAFSALPPGQAAARRRESRELALRLADYVKEHGIDLVLLAGDLFDSASPFRETGEQLAAALGQMRARVFISPGNHDWYGPGSPWETVDCGVRRKYLESEYKKSLHAETTRDCRQGCTGCGMNALAGGKCPCER